MVGERLDGNFYRGSLKLKGESLKLKAGFKSNDRVKR